MRKNLILTFIVLFFFWNICFSISLSPQSFLRQLSNKRTLEEDNRSIELNITEQILHEIVWQPIENSLTYNLEKSTEITNGTSIVEYDMIRKIETVTPRQDIEIISSNKSISNSKQIKRVKVPLSVVDDIKGPHSATIFPPDDRERITNTDEYPWSSICKLYITAADNTKWIGSGAIIDEFHVLTAGHNVYSHDNGGWASSVEVVPGMDGTYEPFGSAMVIDMRSYTGWTEDEIIRPLL